MVNYKNTTIQFCEIENIHHVRQSYCKLQYLLQTSTLYDNKKLLAGFENCGWFETLSGILKAACEIAETLKVSWKLT